MGGPGPGSLLPADLRSKAEAQRPAGNRGIGGGAPENRATAGSRARAMGEAIPAEEEQASAQPEKVEEKIDLTACPSCGHDLLDEWNFCAKCGRDLLPYRDPIKYLGIQPFTKQDVEDYIFKGFVRRTIKVLGKDLVVRTSLTNDLKTVDDWMMNDELKEKNFSRKMFEQLHGLSMTLLCVEQLDGAPIGEDLKKRHEWIGARGTALADILNDRVITYNAAWTRFVNKQENLISGS